MTIMGSVNYDSDTALIVVDVQNDFADPAGNLYVKGGEEVVPVINEEIMKAEASGARVAYTADWHPDIHAPLSEGRRDLAGTLRGGHLGSRVSRASRGRRAGSSQRDQR